MGMEQKIDVLKKMSESKLFQGLSPADIEVLHGAAKSKTLRTGELVLREGDQGDFFYWLKSGRLDVQINQVNSNAGQIILNSVKPGEFIGEMVLLGKNRRTATVIVRNDADFLSWSYSDCAKIFQTKPALGLRVMTNLASMLADRLQDMNLQIRNYTDTLGANLLKYLE